MNGVNMEFLPEEFDEDHALPSRVSVYENHVSKY
jgi:hypothetical protein